jgi:fucose permease
LSATPPGSEILVETQGLNASESRRALSGFLLFGILTSALGAFLPAWGYHLQSHFTTVGNYFLSLNAGLLIALRVAFSLLPRKGIVFTLVLASSVACGAFLALAFTPIAAPPWWRGVALLFLGFAAGLLNAAVFHAVSPLYFHDRASTVTLAGTLYGLGCFLTALLVAGTYYVYTVTAILVLFAAIPGLFIIVFARGKFPSEILKNELPLRRVIQDFKNPGAVLFALLLFFQFGNEWSIAGWLPIFLIRRLGISPEGSLWMLAFYWGSLLVGRVAASGFMKIVSHGKLLLWSIVLALFGCILLTYTTNRFGANTGILFIGCGFASIYPLLVEKIGHRFRYFHPGLYNGIFSFAFTGGLMAPAILGYLAQRYGVGVVMVMPMLGTFLVFVLFLMILLEAKLSGEVPRKA